MSIFQKVIFQGEAFMTWYKTPTQPSSSFFIEKDLKSKCWKKMSEPKTQKGGYIMCLDCLPNVVQIVYDNIDKSCCHVNTI